MPGESAPCRNDAAAVANGGTVAADCRAAAAYSATNGRFISAVTAWRGAMPS